MTENPFLNSVREKASAADKKIVFPDATDERSLRACRVLIDESIARPGLVGTRSIIETAAKELNISLEGVEIFDPCECDKIDEYAQAFYEKRKHKGMTAEKARATMNDSLYLSGYLLNDGTVDVVVGGNESSTGDVMRAAILTVGTLPGISVVSSFFIMTWPDKMYCFGDCAINPDPTSEQLADIAISSAGNFSSITGIEPKVAMLSFSTNGSADHEMTEKVREATKLVKEKAPELAADGEMQLDAAIVPAIGEKKFPGSNVAGQANTMIFPDLNAGNIGYKLTQRLAGAEAVGPIVQGLAKPYCDLSRGCSVDDMVNVASICALMA